MTSVGDRSRAPAAPRLLIVTHIRRADSHWIEELAGERGIESVIRCPIVGDALPPPSEVDAVIVLGGNMSADQDEHYPALRGERHWLGAAVADDLPVFGICLGAQILALTLGGSVHRGESGLEHGWIDVVPEPTAKHPLTPALAGTHFSFHSDSYEAPPGAEILARSDRYVQAWTLGPAFCIQFHPELSPDGVRELVAKEGAKLAKFGIDSTGWVAEATDRMAQARATVGRIIGGWLDQSIPTHVPPSHRAELQ